MLPQHLLTESTQRRAVRLASGEKGALFVRVVYQARGKDRDRAPSFRAWFTADDAHQEWDEDDQEYDRSSTGAEFATQQELDVYVSRNYAVE